MRHVEVWTLALVNAGSIEQIARVAEALGFDGLGFADTQNLAGDPYAALGIAARVTQHLRLSTRVTNPLTRHAAVTASAIATIQAESGGRAVLGIGRGDSALGYIGRPPVGISAFARYLTAVQGYLRGEEVLLDNGYRSRNEWIAPTPTRPKVPVDVAATGPRVIALGARLAERVTFAVGADPRRLAWAVDYARHARTAAGLEPETLALGAYVNVVAHRDAARARNMVRGTVASFAHFSGMSPGAGELMPREDHAIVEDINRRYDMSGHLRCDAGHVSAMDDAFVDRFGIAGSPAYCAERLQELVGLGLDHLVLVGPGPDVAVSDVADAWMLLGTEVMPALKSARPHPP